MKKDAAKMFEPLIQDMQATISQYELIQTQVTDAVFMEMAKKAISQIYDAAGFTINILKRNLFERTADVGYLSTDGEIIEFLKYANSNNDKDASLEEKKKKIRTRLAEYQFEYTVYNEIIILDVAGNILANLNPENRVSFSKDPLLKQTQDIDLHKNIDEDKYVETFRPTDLMPGHGNVLIYSQKIEDPKKRIALGTLCLCFDFEDEIAGIFKDLKQGNENIICGILDEKGVVLSTCNTKVLPQAKRVPVKIDAEFTFMNLGGKEYIMSTVPTEGYQGFYGLTWYGLAMIEMGHVFSMDQNNDVFEKETIVEIQNYFKDLANIKNRSDLLLEDMKRDGLNGIIQAIKFQDKTFVEIIKYIEEIGTEINSIFNLIFSNLMQTVGTSLFNELQFRAFQGNNIADRNLYERANDVCWWALTPLFRETLTRRETGTFEDQDSQNLRERLQYINDLYTPYLRLALTDKAGEIIAVSNPPLGVEEHFVENNLPKGQEFIGTKIDKGLLAKTMALPSKQDYAVTDFLSTPLYGARPTYIYSTAIRDSKNISKIVGTILIVFDAEPQFKEMLMDILPRNEDKKIIEGSFALFADRKKTILASTSPEYPVGSILELDDNLFSLKNGERGASIITLTSRTYAMGMQVSAGYREYKRTDGYRNDILSMVFIPM
ncbi:cache domain-containing protein [Desulfobacter vibrioformis]|uniref:cache domain-containing protein n=1 Tax=Desulfobacter vibrioformis TaxID=34031 RepID=UPI0014702703|nr:cache domain-containing protein [Desulfobacter vibrioformis]